MATIQESTVEEKIDINTLENDNLDLKKDNALEQVENIPEKKNMINIAVKKTLDKASPWRLPGQPT